MKEGWTKGGRAKEGRTNEGRTKEGWAKEERTKEGWGGGKGRGLGGQGIEEGLQTWRKVG